MEWPASLWLVFIPEIILSDWTGFDAFEILTGDGATTT
jgi:hypothetical protein